MLIATRLQVGRDRRVEVLIDTVALLVTVSSARRTPLGVAAMPAGD